MRENQTENAVKHSPIIVVHLDARDAGNVIRFKKLCDEKFGQRFQHDQNFRHQAVDVLLARVENVGK
jgi:hypothetical protein